MAQVCVTLLYKKGYMQLSPFYNTKTVGKTKASYFDVAFYYSYICTYNDLIAM